MDAHNTVSCSDGIRGYSMDIICSVVSMDDTQEYTITMFAIYEDGFPIVLLDNHSDRQDQTSTSTCQVSVKVIGLEQSNWCHLNISGVSTVSTVSLAQATTIEHPRVY